MPQVNSTASSPSSVPTASAGRLAGAMLIIHAEPSSAVLCLPLPLLALQPRSSPTRPPVWPPLPSPAAVSPINLSVFASELCQHPSPRWFQARLHTWFPALSSAWSPSYAIDFITREGRGMLLAKVDIRDAYRLIPIYPHDRHLLGMSWDNQLGVDLALPFSLRSAPFIFIQFAEA